MGRRLKYLLVVVSLVTTALLAEAGTRIFFKVTKKDIGVYRHFSFERSAKIMMPDPILGYKLIPNVSRNAFTSEFQTIYTTNSHGLRDKEFVDTDTFKILFLGDSMTFGEGVAAGHRFSDLIGKELDNVSVINAGVPGYGVHQMYAWLRDHGLGFRPDLVVYAIIPDDFMRAIYSTRGAAPHLIVSDQGNVGRLKQWTKRSLEKMDAAVSTSYLYSLLKVRCKIALMWARLKQRDKQVWKEISETGGMTGQKITTDAHVEKMRACARQIFSDSERLLSGNNGGLLVVNIDTESVPWLAEELSAQKILYLDLAPELKKKSRLRFEIDQHYTERGHRAVADLLGPYLRRLLADRGMVRPEETPRY